MGPEDVTTIALCQDLQFPEVTSARVLPGADMGLAPTWGWEVPYARAHAYGNGIYVAASIAVSQYKENCGLRLPSQVVSPADEVLVERRRDGFGVALADIDGVRDCARLRDVRVRQPHRWLVGRNVIAPRTGQRWPRQV